LETFNCEPANSNIGLVSTAANEKLLSQAQKDIQNNQTSPENNIHRAGEEVAPNTHLWLPDFYLIGIRAHRRNLRLLGPATKAQKDLKVDEIKK
jgi:hypothetical protein